MSRALMRPNLSIVVPAYREQNRIGSTLQKLDEVLRRLGRTYEIICVVDGIVDQTLGRVKKLKLPHLQIYAYEHNRGKGHAVRYGMARAKGELVGFMDANGINSRSLPLLLEHLAWYRADIVIGSKRHPASRVKYPPIRRLISWLSQLLIRLLFGVDVRDTQVGLKVFRRAVLEKTLPRLLIKDWAFDVEMLAVAHHLGFTRIYESPVELELSATRSTSAVLSKGLARVLFFALIDTLAIFYRLNILRYYDDASSDKWRRHPDLEFWLPK